MTWSTLLIIILFVVIAALTAIDAAFIRELRVDNTRLRLRNDVLLHQLSLRHPSYSGYRHTDQVVSDLKFCFQCDGLRPLMHFAEATDHSHI